MKDNAIETKKYVADWGHAKQMAEENKIPDKSVADWGHAKQMAEENKIPDKSVSSQDTDRVSVKETCEHYWCWLSPAGSSKSARICMTCHEPNVEWLNKIEELKDGEDVCYSDEDTLFKVQKALNKLELDTDSSSLTINIINGILNEGILFRERRLD